MEPLATSIDRALTALRANLPRSTRSAVARRLLADVLVVAASGRPACMVDYAAITAAQLRECALRALRCWETRGGGFPDVMAPLVTLELGDCAFLVNPQLLSLHHRPALVGFEGGYPGLLCDTEAGGGYTTTVLADLEALLAAVSQASYQSVPASGPAVFELVNLPTPRAATLPTLYGFLLGYPVLLAPRDETEAARGADAMSSSGLRRCRVVLSIVPAGDHDPSMPTPALPGVLHSWSVPLALAGDPIVRESERRWLEQQSAGPEAVLPRARVVRSEGPRARDEGPRRVFM